MSNHYQIEIEEQPIELYKLLKIANLVSGGGEAKMLISQGYVLLNGEQEIQKRKKIFHGDIVEFNGDLIELECHKEPIVNSDRVKKLNKPNAHSAQNKKKEHSSSLKEENKKSLGKRRPINF